MTTDNDDWYFQPEEARKLNDMAWEQCKLLRQAFAPSRSGLKLAFEDWKAEGQRLKALAPFDFLEAVDDLLGRKTTTNLPKPHRQSA